MDEPKKRESGVRPCRRRRWSRAEREQLLRDFRASSLTQVRFAAQRRINLGTLRNWIYKPGAGGDRPGSFAPVQIVGARGPRPSGCVTVRWPQGLEVELAVDLDGSGVVRLGRELLAPCLRWARRRRSSWRPESST